MGSKQARVVRPKTKHIINLECPSIISKLQVKWSLRNLLFFSKCLTALTIIVLTFSLGFWFRLVYRKVRDDLECILSFALSLNSLSPYKFIKFTVFSHFGCFWSDLKFQPIAILYSLILLSYTLLHTPYYIFCTRHYLNNTSIVFFSEMSSQTPLKTSCVFGHYSCVMNHIPLHPFAMKSHPNLIPSLPNLPPMFPPFLPFPDAPSLHRSVTHHSSLCHLSPVTCHLSHRHYSSLSVSIITVLCYFGSLPPLSSSEHHSRLCGWMITI